MRMTVIGTGYLGAVHAACMADLGHEVLGVDANQDRIEMLSRGLAPFYEPGLDELLERGVRTGELLLISPTVGRTDWQEEIATLCGVNLPLMAYRLALGQTPPAVPCATSPQRHAWRSHWHYRLPSDQRAHTVVSDAYFRWCDPLPGLYHYGYEHGFERIWHRLRRRVRSFFKPHQRLA